MTSYVNTNHVKISGGKMCRAGKFGFVVTGTHNEAVIKLLSMVCVCACVCRGVMFQERGCR